jgi:dihydroorotase-like cyclic amidohydrolase
MKRTLATVIALLAGPLLGCGPADEGSDDFDLVITNGRVMDPESGLDAVRTIGIRGGSIAVIADGEIDGARTIDAIGLVVAPGFVDLHEHGQQEESYALMVRDGVTSALELEVGTADVGAWYAEREGGQIVNYGVSIGHIGVRMDLLDDPSEGILPAGIGGSGSMTSEQLDEMESRIREGLAQGAVAVGFGSAYTPGATMDEIERMFGVAGDVGASIHIHMRNGVQGFDSTLAAARRAGAALHVVHINSTSGRDIDRFLEMVEQTQASGQDLTTETYPYGAGMTEIQSALFDDWESWTDEDFQRHQLVSTGQRATRETFAEARRQGGTVIIHSRTEDMTRTAVFSPLTIIASDGFIVDGQGHPRTSGTYSKVLGQYVRDEGGLTLMDALRKMTVMPARRLEARVPSMANKGRIRVGADADITIFDPEAVIDRSTYEDATIPASGITYVIIEGEIVVDEGEVTDARHGRAIRAPT